MLKRLGYEFTIARDGAKAMITAMILGIVGFLSANPVLAHGISDADKHAMLEGGYLKFVSLGASHMVTGVDHLLFLFGVIFFLTKFKDIVKFITAFTLGHSITLIFATFMHISANYYLVDAVIALTVFYKGFDNSSLWATAACLCGLFHSTSAWKSVKFGLYRRCSFFWPDGEKQNRSHYSARRQIGESCWRECSCS